MLRDVRHALRQLARSPGFTAVVVLTLALGIGATTAMFTLVNAVILRPLGYPEAERVMTVWSFNPRQGGGRYTVSGPDFLDWRAQSSSFSEMALFRDSQAAVSVGKTAESALTAAVSEGFFRVLGASPRAGRLFSDREADVVVVADSFVRRHFGGDAARALGATIKVQGQLRHIVGVLPAGFAFPPKTELWSPFDTTGLAATERGAHNYRVIARLRPQVSPAAAQTEMSGIAARLSREYPRFNTNKDVQLVPLPEVLVERYQATLWILFGAVALVLLIACANVANLLLARGLRRLHELAVRAALGAGRARIARQLLTESLVLALIGGALGLLAAQWALDALLALAPAGIPRLDEVAIDRGTFVFCGLTALTVCLVTGLFPILQAGRTDLTTALKAAGRSTQHRGRLRDSLVVAQLALSLVLLTGAGLLLRSLRQLAAVELGYRPEKLLVMTTYFPGAGSEGSRALSFFAELSRRAAALPGVSAVSYAGALPVDGDAGGSNGNYSIEGRAALAPGQGFRQNALWRQVGPGYFAVLGVPVRAGRELDARDTVDAPATVVINESMARAAWPGESPLGRRIRIGWDQNDLWMTIVGVVADTRQRALDRPIGQELYVPAAQHPRLATFMKVLARTELEPAAFTDAFRRLAAALDPEVPIKMTTAELLVAESLSAPRFRTLLIGLFAAVALVLALVGVGGVMACVVAERRNEIGIRMAIGAQPAKILRHFLLRALRLATIGLALGLAAAVPAARVLQGMLYEVRGTDPAVLGAVSATLLVCALVAAAWPAARAARVSPMTVLRGE